MKCNRLKVNLFLVIITCLFALVSNGQPSNRGQNKQQRPSVEELFKMMDANEDGKLSLEEVKGPLKNDFSKVDVDENGFITKEELEKAPKPNRQGGKQEKQSREKGNAEKLSTTEIFKKMDTDNDGKLSEKEVKGPLAKDFSKIDANEDGFLSKEELEKAPKTKRK